MLLFQVPSSALQHSVNLFSESEAYSCYYDPETGNVLSPIAHLSGANETGSFGTALAPGLRRAEVVKELQALADTSAAGKLP